MVNQFRNKQEVNVEELRQFKTYTAIQVKGVRVNKEDKDRLFAASGEDSKKSGIFCTDKIYDLSFEHGVSQKQKRLKKAKTLFKAKVHTCIYTKLDNNF